MEIKDLNIGDVVRRKCWDDVADEDRWFRVNFKGSADSLCLEAIPPDGKTYLYLSGDDWIRKEDVMADAKDKIAYVVTFLRPSGSMQFIEYRRESEFGWSESKQRMNVMLGQPKGYQDYCTKYGYLTYNETFLDRSQVDNLSQSYDTTNTSLRALGLPDDEELDFQSKELRA